MNKKETYLGDGVYAEYNNGEYILYTSDGITKSNIIYFDVSVIQALKMFVKQCEGEE